MTFAFHASENDSVSFYALDCLVLPRHDPSLPRLLLGMDFISPLGGLHIDTRSRFVYFIDKPDIRFPIIGWDNTPHACISVSLSSDKSPSIEALSHASDTDCST